MTSVYSNGDLIIATSRDGHGGLFTHHGSCKVAGSTPEGDSVEATVRYWDELVSTDLEVNAIREKLPYWNFDTIER